jgi:hypothetical protein
VLQDQSKLYLATTDFITGIEFSEREAAKSTNYLQYVYLMLYLERKYRSQEQLTPLESEVIGKIHTGDITWLPDGVVIGGAGGLPEAEAEAEDAPGGALAAEQVLALRRTVDAVVERIGALEETEQTVVQALREIKADLQEIKDGRVGGRV